MSKETQDKIGDEIKHYILATQFRPVSEYEPLDDRRKGFVAIQLPKVYDIEILAATISQYSSKLGEISIIRSNKVDQQFIVTFPKAAQDLKSNIRANRKYQHEDAEDKRHTR